jgi:putative membrane protein
MRFLLLTGGLGLILLIGLIFYVGFGDIARAVATIGWGLALIAILRLLQISGAGKAWSLLFPKESLQSIPVYVGLRLVREGVNTLLPVAQVGGEFIGARLLAQSGLTAGAAMASVIVDLLLQAATQVAFTLTGLTLLIVAGSNTALVREVALGVLFIVVGLVGFFLVQRFGGFGWLQRKLAQVSVGQRFGLDQISDLNANIQRIHRDHWVVARCVMIHLLVWFTGAGEVWIALTFLQQPVTISECLVIESLSQALRSATFVVPASLGVQEGGLIALCAAFSLPATIAVALSLTKRVAELTVGVAGLIIWHVVESHYALRNKIP